MAQQEGISVERRQDFENAYFSDLTSHLKEVDSTGLTDYIDCRDIPVRAISIVNGAVTAVIFTVQGSQDKVNWIDIAFSPTSNATLVKTAQTVAGDAKTQLLIPKTEFYAYVAINVTTANTGAGTVFQAISSRY